MTVFAEFGSRFRHDWIVPESQPSSLMEGMIVLSTSILVARKMEGDCCQEGFPGGGAEVTMDCLGHERCGLEVLIVQFYCRYIASLLSWLGSGAFTIC